MRKKNCCKLRVVFRLMPLQPEYFRGGVSGQNSIAHEVYDLFHATKFPRYNVAFLNCASVVPEFGRPDDLAIIIEGDEAVLLRGYTYSFDILRVDLRFSKGFFECSVQGVYPYYWVLLLVSRRQAFYEPVAFCRPPSYRSVLSVDYYGLCALCPIINAHKVAFRRHDVFPP